MGKPEQPERRQYQRIRKHFILTYYDYNHPAVRYDASQLKNLSLGGMCLITSTAFSPSTRLGIELKTPFVSDLTHLEGIVLESREKIKDIIYETRLKFEDMPEATKAVLNKIIIHFEKEESLGHE
jgi:c-di-GMP-binding flagellar brake protein YcgR